MPDVVASSRLFVPAPPAACFARLADFTSWERWMPRSFRPVAGPSRALAVGDVIRVRIEGVPGTAALRVERVDPSRVIAWSGGVPGVLSALHAFYFDEAAGGTTVRSEEPWRGVLTRVAPVARRVLAVAERVGAEQLGALARDLADRPAG